MVKKSHNTARLLALLFGLTGLLNMASVHVYSFATRQSAPYAFSGYGYKAPAFRYDLARVKESYSRIPLSFVANYGQADKKVKFTSRGSGYSLAIAQTTFTLAVADPRNKNNEESRIRSRASASVLQATLLGANAAANLTGLERLPARTNYFIGNDPRRWKTNVPTYAKVKYSGLYPGVDLVFYGNRDLLEYDFIVSPGADPDIIALGFEGITEMRVDEKGDLILRAGAGEIRQSRPVVYQQIDDARRIIPASYLIKGKKQIAFQIANYDRSKPLVIDPTLAFSTYLGGSGTDSGEGIAVDSAGYITGQANGDYPTTPGAFQTVPGGSSDGFVTKLNSTGTALVYSTFLGGTGVDSGHGIAVNEAGNAFVTGSSDSPNFPVTPGAFQTVKAAGQDAFVTQLSATGTSLAYSTYLGGSGSDLANDIALDTAGNASVVGLTGSSDFPTTADAIQSAPGGNNDAFITRLNAPGTGLVFSTYLGGSEAEGGRSVAVDPTGSIYLTGVTFSADFPTTPGAFQTAFGGLQSDAFVAKVVFSSFDICFTDDGNGDLFQFDSTTGEYRFTQCNAGGLTLTGTGALSRQGCLLLLEDNQSGRRVGAHFNHCNNKGQGVIQIESGRKRTFVITDKDTSNSNCACN